MATAHWPWATARTASKDFDPESGAAGEIAAIAAAPPVKVARQHLHRQRAVGAVDVEDVESRIDGAARGLPEHGDDTGEIGVLGLVSVDLRNPGRGELVSGRRDMAAAEIVREAAGMAQLDPGQRSPLVNGVGHVPVIDDVALIEQARNDGDWLIGLGMDHAGFRAERGPAALRLHLPVHGIGARPLHPGAGALRHLEEPVLQRLRSDGDRLEQRVVAGIARHGGYL